MDELPLNLMISRAAKEQPVSQEFKMRVQSRLRRVERHRRWRNWSAGLAVAAVLMLVFWKLAWPSQVSPLALDLVEHHETCWEVPSSAPRSQQYQAWIQSHPGSPLTKGEQVGRIIELFDRRGCPVLGANRSPHWMYRDGKGGMVSVFLFPLSDLDPAIALPTGIREDACGNYNILTWTDGGFLWGMVAQVAPEQMEQWIRQSALSGYEPGQLGRTIAAVNP